MTNPDPPRGRPQTDGRTSAGNTPWASGDRGDTPAEPSRYAGDRPTGSYPAGPVAAAVPVPPDLVDHPRYQVLDFLGAGGMGSVYVARHRLMDRVVALKVVHPQLVNNPVMVERFRREARAAASLDHPNIVPAYDADQAGSTHFLVMKFVAGVTLDRLLAEGGPLPVAGACEYARQAALGLQHAYERGMVHRDIKPHNLMLRPDGRVKILDFGLARFVSEAGLPPDDTDFDLGPAGPDSGSVHDAPTARPRRPGDGLTTGYVGLGTADYMAPEEWADARRADIRADIYSLGCTLYHLLAGRPPCDDAPVEDKHHCHEADAPPPLDRVRPDVPPALAACVRRMMAKDPADRFQTPAEVALALARFCGLADRRVLVVQDDPDARATVARALQAQGFTVDLAAGGHEGLERLRGGRRPSLILLDLRTPRAGGWDFLREQKADPRVSDIPVVILSGADLGPALAAALAAAEHVQEPRGPHGGSPTAGRHAGPEAGVGR